MKNKKIISIIESDNPQYVTSLLRGLSFLYLRNNRSNIIIDARSSKSDIIWSVYAKKEIKYVDDMFKVIANINTAMLKSYLDPKREILCVQKTNGNYDNLNCFIEPLQAIYDEIIVVYTCKAQNNDFVLNNSNVILTPFIKDPVSFDNYEKLYFELSGQKTKDIAIIPVMFETGTDFDFDIKDSGAFLKDTAVLPFDFEIQKEISNAKFLFNDISNKFVKAVQDLIIKISESCNNLKIEDSCDYQRRQTYNILKNKLHKDLIEKMKEYSDDKDQQKLRDVIKIHADNLLNLYDVKLSSQVRRQLFKELSDDIAGLGILEDLLADNEITEIMVNGCENIFIEKSGKLIETELKFYDANKLKIVIDRIASSVGRHIDDASPIVDARLKDGSRVNAVIAPVALNGPVLTIRKFSKLKLSAEDIVSYGSASVEMIDYLKKAVRNKKNILISGGTGSGKTTLLNVLSSFISQDERIITVEDSAELQLQQKHVIKLETRAKSIEATSEITIRQLVVNSLRMRPDRIIVGECRSGETLDMLQAMNTGHDGSMTTVHSNSCKDAVSRLLVMTLMSGVDLPEKSIVSMIASAINIIVQIKRFPDGSRKISEISEVKKTDDNLCCLLPVFQYDFKTGVYKTLINS